jgi:hypothetical protein
MVLDVPRKELETLVVIRDALAAEQLGPRRALDQAFPSITLPPGSFYNINSINGLQFLGSFSIC